MVTSLLCDLEAKSRHGRPLSHWLRAYVACMPQAVPNEAYSTAAPWPPGTVLLVAPRTPSTESWCIDTVKFRVGTRGLRTSTDGTT